MIPHALGQEVTFVEGEGPKLKPVRSKDDLVGNKDKKKLGKHAPKPEKYEPILQEPDDIKDLSPQITPAQPDTRMVKHDIKTKKPVFIKGQ